jgi:hypothetical protein
MKRVSEVINTAVCLPQTSVTCHFTLKQIDQQQQQQQQQY